MTHEPPAALCAGAKRSDEFGRLLSGAINSITQYEVKTAPVIEDSLGELAGLSRASIQRYKRWYVPPEPRTVQILADAAVKRGLLNRRWLTRFLRAAAYPAPDALLAALCPVTATAAESGPGPILQNLPPPSYAQFIARKRPFAEAEAVSLLAEARQAVVAHEIDRHVPDLLAVEGQVATRLGEVAAARAAWVEAAEVEGWLKNESWS